MHYMTVQLQFSREHNQSTIEPIYREIINSTFTIHIYFMDQSKQIYTSSKKLVSMSILLRKKTYKLVNTFPLNETAIYKHTDVVKYD
jgi:hypothetical protein